VIGSAANKVRKHRNAERVAQPKTPDFPHPQVGLTNFFRSPRFFANCSNRWLALVRAAGKQVAARAVAEFPELVRLG
jgi:hypothetical protein